MEWYVVQAYSGYEKRVKSSLEERIREEHEKKSKLGDYFGEEPEILIPSERVVELHGNQRRSTDKKFFPGCLLIKMDMNSESWHLVRTTAWVMGFMGGTPQKPQAVLPEEIASIKRRLEGNVETQLFRAGEFVRITDGAFSGFTGTVEDVDSEKQKLRVLVSIFGRATSVEIEFHRVEKE